MNQKRKSLRKEAIELTAKTSKSIMHITLSNDQDEKPQVEIENLEWDKNPLKIRLGRYIIQNGHTMEWYFYLDNPKTVFLRVDNAIFAFDKLNIRELMALVVRGGWNVGLFGKRSKKYASSLSIIINVRIKQIKAHPPKPKDKKYDYVLCKYVYENFCQNCTQTECERRAQ